MQWPTFYERLQLEWDGEVAEFLISMAIKCWSGKFLWDETNKSKRQIQFVLNSWCIGGNFNDSPSSLKTFAKPFAVNIYGQKLTSDGSLKQFPNKAIIKRRKINFRLLRKLFLFRNVLVAFSTVIKIISFRLISSEWERRFAVGSYNKKEGSERNINHVLTVEIVPFRYATLRSDLLFVLRFHFEFSL